MALAASVGAGDADGVISAEGGVEIVSEDGSALLQHVGLAAGAGAVICRGRWVVW